MSAASYQTAKPETMPEDMAESWYADRLGFRLHPFRRVSWTGRAAEQAWAPRLERIREVLREASWRSVATGVRPCALLPGAADRQRVAAEAEAAGLAVEVWPAPEPVHGRYASVAGPHGERGHRRMEIAVGRAKDLAVLRTARVDEDHDTVGRLLGYPSCCREFFVRWRVERECLDTTWPMAASGEATAADPRHLVFDGPGSANVLWRWLDLRPVPHLPCSLACSGTRRLAAALAATVVNAGGAAECAWLDELLSWPVRWTALHGIAEVTTPMLRLATRTDATAAKFTVDLRGNAATTPSVRGLSFPHPVAAPQYTSSAAYARGLAHSEQQAHG